VQMQGAHAVINPSWRLLATSILCYLKLPHLHYALHAQLRQQMTNDAADNNSHMVQTAPILRSSHSWRARPLAWRTHRQPSRQLLLRPSLLLLLL
jgi:hypothetical protein